MLKRLAVLVAVLAVSATGWAENYFLSVSATTTSTTKLLPKDARSVLICNKSTSANIAYVRVFTRADVNMDLTGAATSSHSDLDVGVCKSWPTGASPWAAVAIVSAGTSTVTIDAD